MKIKTIDINAKEWFDKVNGNSYFSAMVTLDYGLKSEQSFVMPMQYGYEDHYKDMAFKALQVHNLIPKQDKFVSHWHYFKDNNIIARYSKIDSLKRNLHKEN